MNKFTNTFNYSIADNRISILDIATSGTATWRDGNWTSFTIDRDLLIRDCKALTAALMSKKAVRVGMADANYEEGAVTIESRDSGRWRIGVEGKTAIAGNGQVLVEMGFDISEAVKAVNRVLSAVISAGQILTPRVDIVRRIADAELIVWNYKHDSAVCYEKDIDGTCMNDCLINGDYYERVLVDVSRDSNSTTLFAFDNGQLIPIVTFPYDASVSFFYKDNESLMEGTAED